MAILYTVVMGLLAAWYSNRPMLFLVGFWMQLFPSAIDTPLLSWHCYGYAETLIV